MRDDRILPRWSLPRTAVNAALVTIAALLVASLTARSGAVAQEEPVAILGRAHPYAIQSV